MNKKSIVAALMIMMSITVFAANNTAEGELKAALKVVPEGDLIQVYYAGLTASDVKLVIKNAEGRIVHRESIDELYSFKRAYNLSQLSYGAYTFELTSAEGRIEQVVDYSNASEATIAYFTKSLDENGSRQLVRVPAGQEGNAKVSVYSNLNGLLYSEVASAEKGFAKIYRLEASSQDETMSIVVERAK